MAQIQPITTWFQGAEHEANIFTLYSDGDNLIDSASFKYQLIEEIIIPEHEEIVDGIVVIIPEQINSQSLITAQLSINGQDYIDWDSSVSANEWIYNWAAEKLDLTIVTI
jgi:hypothetical protein